MNSIEFLSFHCLDETIKVNYLHFNIFAQTIPTYSDKSPNAWDFDNINRTNTERKLYAKVRKLISPLSPFPPHTPLAFGDYIFSKLPL